MSEGGGGPRALAVSCFAAFLVALLAVYWRWCSVQRTALPDLDALQAVLSASHALSRVDIELAAVGAWLSSQQVRELAAELEARTSNGTSRLAVRFARRSDAELARCESLRQVESALAAAAAARTSPAESEASLRVWLLGDSARGRPQWTVGASRDAWTWLGTDKDAAPSGGDMAASVWRLLRATVLFEPSRDEKRAELELAEDNTLSFSLLVSDPADSPLSWDFCTASGLYLEPFLRRVAPAFRAQVDSQVRFFANISAESFKRRASSNGSTLAVGHLRNFVGQTAWNLESPFTTHSTEFMLFVSPAWARPLRLVDSAQAESEAFLVPNFGGVAVLNKVPRLGASAQLSALELAQPMGVFLAQLRTMLGLPPPPPPLGAGACAAASDPLEPCRLAPPSNGGVADWEREMLRRRVTQTHVEKAMRALRSLEALLQSVPFMPMDAAVSQRLEMSVRLLEAAARHAESGAREEALGAAQAAAASATQAFFDPSMLPLLYLPPDQVAAVFAPFFLPVVLHLAISLLRWRRGKT